jgi:predicted outer membrane protein
MKTLLAAVSAFALLASAPAFAQNNNPNRTFVDQAAASNTNQIKLGDLAAQRSTSPAVREFGRWIASDATVLNKTLTSLHRLDGITPNPAVATGSAIVVMGSLNQKRFDEEFLRSVANVSAKDIALYKTVGATGNNNNNGNYKPSLRYYAADAMPMLRAHLVEAHRLMHLANVAGARGNAGGAGTSRMAGANGTSGAAGASGTAGGAGSAGTAGAGTAGTAGR